MKSISNSNINYTKEYCLKKILNARLLKYKSGTVITSLNMWKPVLEQRRSKVRVNNNRSSIVLTGLCVDIFFCQLRQRMAQNLSLHVTFRMLIFLVLLRRSSQIGPMWCLWEHVRAEKMKECSTKCNVVLKFKKMDTARYVEQIFAFHVDSKPQRYLCFGSISTTCN